MGFGSYDESEQENQTVDSSDASEGVSVQGERHDGDVDFSTDASTDELLDQLGDGNDD